MKHIWSTLTARLERGENYYCDVPETSDLSACSLIHFRSQAEFQLGNVEDGLLPSAFLAGLLIASIVYSELTTHYNAFRMTGRILRASDT